MRPRYGGVGDWNLSNVYEIYPQWRFRYPDGTTHNTEHVFSLQVPEPVPVTGSIRASTWRTLAAVGGSCAQVLFVVESRGDRGAAAASRQRSKGENR